MRTTCYLLGALIAGCAVSPIAEHDAGLDAGSRDAGADGDAGTTDGGVDPGTADGGLWPDDVSALEATRGVGGFEQGCPVDGGMVFGATYVVPFDGGPMTYMECVQGTRVVRSGSKALSAGGLASLEATLRDLSRSLEDACGYDKGKLSLSITTSTKVLQYVDSFYVCRHEPGVVYVDNIDPVFARLVELAQ